jgi:endonuclease/exonuclease/phosphatase (EEP) superfamily protein YafD
MNSLKTLFTRLFWICLALFAVGLTAGALAPLFARRFWMCELATHFQLQYVVLLAVISLLFALDSRYKWAVFTLVVTVATFCYYLLPLYVGGNAGDPKSRTLRIVSSNIAFFNKTQEELIKFVREENPDVILLYELSPEWTQTLKQLEADYPYFEIDPRERHSGIGLYSRLPLESKEVTTVGSWPSPVIVAKLIVNQVPLTIVAAHPDPPVSWTMTESRNDQLIDLADLLVQQSTPLVVTGDLNTSSWTPAFERLVHDTGLRDSRKGFGVQASWNAFVPVLRTPIDHCLVSPRVRVLDRRVGRNIGSDHFPIVLDLLVK